jgi:hypothetical protein
MALFTFHLSDRRQTHVMRVLKHCLLIFRNLNLRQTFRPAATREKRYGRNETQAGYKPDFD